MQNCFIIVAVISYINWRFRGFMGFGNWHEEVVDGFSFFNGWLHGLEKIRETTSRRSDIVVLILHGCFHQVSLKLVKRRWSEGAVGGKHPGFNPNNQPYDLALQTWHCRFSQTVFSLSCFHLIANSQTWSCMDLTNMSYRRHMAWLCPMEPYKFKDCGQSHGLWSTRPRWITLLQSTDETKVGTRIRSAT